jgi:hypothetical protein
LESIEGFIEILSLLALLRKEDLGDLAGLVPRVINHQVKPTAVYVGYCRTSTAFF